MTRRDPIGGEGSTAAAGASWSKVPRLTKHQESTDDSRPSRQKLTSETNISAELFADSQFRRLW